MWVFGLVTSMEMADELLSQPAFNFRSLNTYEIQFNLSQ
jgi:hypothetical protein